MDKAITASEANQGFSRMLRAVADGDSFTITSRGRAVARVIPIEAESQVEKLRRLDDYLEMLPNRHAGLWKREDLYER